MSHRACIFVSSPQRAVTPGTLHVCSRCLPEEQDIQKQFKLIWCNYIERLSF